MRTQREPAKARRIRGRETTLGLALAWTFAGAAGCEEETQLAPDELACVGREDGTTYCIDVYEASRIDATSTDQGTSSEGAVSLRGRLPWTNVEWADARAACERAGKRLCTAQEWEDACDGQVGPGGNVYPYGDEVQDGVCVTELTVNDDPLPTGSRDGCVSDFGAFDLGGNVWEWVGTSADAALGIGGGINSDATHFCRVLPQGAFFDDPTDQDRLLGFRCCSDF